MTDLLSRLESKIEFTDNCWIWTASKDKDGYPWINIKGHTRAHKLVYETVVERVPQGLQLDHLCRNRACVYPDHLEPVTPRENVRRGETGIDNRSKTHCPAGHPYTPENTYIQIKGTRNGHPSRSCLTCRRERDRVPRKRARS